MVGERQKGIVELLRTEKVMPIQKLADYFQVSLVTIRRDLEVLAKEGMIKRIYGGAAIVESVLPEDKTVFAGRLMERQENKEIIAELAVNMIREGDTVYLDTGTTVAMLAQKLTKMKYVTVITNSLAVMNVLQDAQIPVYGLGGFMRGAESAFSGSMTVSMLQNFCFDWAFLGTGGISLELGVTDYFFETTQLRRAVVERSKKTVLLADSSKFGKSTPAIVFPLNTVDCVVTDEQPEEMYEMAFWEAEVELLYPERSVVKEEHIW